MSQERGVVRGDEERPLLQQQVVDELQRQDREERRSRFKHSKWNPMTFPPVFVLAKAVARKATGQPPCADGAQKRRHQAYQRFKLRLSPPGLPASCDAPIPPFNPLLQPSLDNPRTEACHHPLWGCFLWQYVKRVR